MRGRVLAVNSFVLGLLYPIGTLVQGALADVTGLRWVTAASGLTLLAVTIVLTIPHVRRVRSGQVTATAATASRGARV
jgi:acyl-coenzyme A thioesterase PaaI-like protein